MSSTLTQQRSGAIAREGFALALALVALVIIGALVGSIFFASTQEFRVGENTLTQTRALTAAEYGLNNIRSNWNLADNNRLKTGDTLVKVIGAGSGSKATVTVTRVNDFTLWVVSEGIAGAGTQREARKRIGAAMRWGTPNISYLGALTIGASITLGGSATVSGNDTVPSGWNCPPAGSAIAGMAMTDTTAGLKLNGCASKGCLKGKPALLQTAQARDSNTYFNYGGGVTYTSLAAMANLTYPGGTLLNGIAPVVAGGNCVTTSTTNWGDVNRALPTPGACESYFPIIHVTGDLKVTGGSGQGILLVDGNLAASGGWAFDGVVIVRGNIDVTGTGGKFFGAVMAANVNLNPDNAVLGNASITYSNCAIVKTLMSMSYPVRMPQRAWVEMF